MEPQCPETTVGCISTQERNNQEKGVALKNKDADQAGEDHEADDAEKHAARLHMIAATFFCSNSNEAGDEGNDPCEYVNQDVDRV